MPVLYLATAAHAQSMASYFLGSSLELQHQIGCAHCHWEVDLSCAIGLTHLHRALASPESAVRLELGQISPYFIIGIDHKRFERHAASLGREVNCYRFDSQGFFELDHMRGIREFHIAFHVVHCMHFKRRSQLFVAAETRLVFQ